MVSGEILKLYQEFSHAFDGNDDAKAKSILPQLKKQLVVPAFPAVIAGGRSLSSASSSIGAAEISLARDVLEMSVLMAARVAAADSVDRSAQFSRAMEELRPFYFDIHEDLLPRSARERLILGLNLTRLLSEGKIADFHAELELISASHMISTPGGRAALAASNPEITMATQQDRFIRFPVILERYLEEGSYGKLMKARAEVPAECYKPFVQVLDGQVRSDVAGCCEAAYESLSLAECQKFLLFGEGPSEAHNFEQYIAQQRPAWRVENGRVFFPPKQQLQQQQPQQPQQESVSEQQKADETYANARGLIEDSIAYSKELSKII